ncbi:DEAD/DEAH box helicase, partial [Vibrio mediterranei]|uniref:DEAD/DEAH box helicase n=1 Tax=Vibrio mediterranei TaxID=689 RepID=UPI001EFC4113
LISNNNDHLLVEENGLLKHKLYPYQRHGVHWLLFCLINSIGTILGDDMGLGKTAQVIALVAEALQKKLASRVMIVVPNSLLENWRREFQFFCSDIVPYLHFGNERTGLAENLSPYKVLIMPYTIMTSDIDMIEDLEVDILVFDEASMLKNPRSERRLAAGRINARSIIAMTGTPVENNLLDLWSLVDLISPGYLDSEENFVNKYVGKTISETLEKDLNILEENISQVMIRRMKEDILTELPDKIDIHQAIALSLQERKTYRELVDAIQNSDESCVLAEIVRLQKYTSHPFLLNDISKPSVEDLKQASAKFTRLFELLCEINEREEKVLIFANHIAMIDLLKEAIESEFSTPVFTIDGRIEVIERQNAIDNFSALTGFAALVLNPKTAGMGLNITAANHVVHYSRQWNPALEEQATARAFRNGQEKNVNAFYLYYADTIEEVIDERLRQKKALADSVVSVVDEKLTETDFYLEHLKK